MIRGMFIAKVKVEISTHSVFHTAEEKFCTLEINVLAFTKSFYEICMQKTVSIRRLVYEPGDRKIIS